ncbi:MAG: hypothetical protein M3Q69_00880 [Acidobacteriota bacterium]|nr:hypothetical protein [Acidobacteriota bacterium]
MSASSWPEAVPEVAAAEPQQAPVSVAARWNPLTRIVFRFLFLYLGLYNVESLFGLIPISFATQLVLWYDELWEPVTVFTGNTLFGVDARPRGISGSGDTTAAFVLTFIYLMIALAGTIIWSVLDRRRVNYATLHAWFRSYVRFAVAISMISYGVAKVVKLQFPPILLDRLTQPLGSISPMGLLWTFMSFSVLYNVFTGSAEMLGGILLTTRRTATLGALVTAGAMANVFVLNMAYDVPVKLYSGHLLFMSLVIAAPDAQRFANVFLLNRTAAPAVLRPSLRNPRWDVLLRAARTLMIAAFILVSLRQAITQMKEWNAQPLDKTPLYGIWNVEWMKYDGVERPPLTTDTIRWRRLTVSSTRVASLTMMNDERTRLMMKLDGERHTLDLMRKSPPAMNVALKYTQPDRTTLVLNGLYNGHKVEARLTQTATPQFVLMTRGFHWINEFPFNR